MFWVVMKGGWWVVESEGERGLGFCSTGWECHMLILVGFICKEILFFNNNFIFFSRNAKLL